MKWYVDSVRALLSILLQNSPALGFAFGSRLTEKLGFLDGSVT